MWNYRIEPELDGWCTHVTQDPHPIWSIAMVNAATVVEWIAERAAAHDFRTELVPFTALRGWSFDDSTGNLRHHTGRFFTVAGLRVSVEDRWGERARRTWDQPILNQPEHAILGLLLKEFDGIPHALMQAKMEPGNPKLVQLSPTVQATWSNFTRIHNGAPVKYVEYFTSKGSGRIVVDVLQSELGDWFYRKTNRNVIVLVEEDVPVLEDFRWVPLNVLGQLLRFDNVVNMDARSVLACLPAGFLGGQSGPGADVVSLCSWFTGVRMRYHLDAQLVPLSEVAGWACDPASIAHEHGRYFRIVGISVEAGSREITSWTQPLLEPVDRGVACFLACRIEGRLHVLAHARVEGGFVSTVELGPTVQCTPSDYAHLPVPDRPRFLDVVLEADPASVLYEAVHSEEGGRFLNAQSRYMVVEVDAFEPPDDYRWVTPGQLTYLTQHSHYLNMQARTLLSCLTLAVAEESL